MFCIFSLFKWQHQSDFALFGRFYTSTNFRKIVENQIIKPNFQNHLMNNFSNDENTQ